MDFNAIKAEFQLSMANVAQSNANKTKFIISFPTVIALILRFWLGYKEPKLNFIMRLHQSKCFRSAESLRHRVSRKTLKLHIITWIIQFQLKLFEKTNFYCSIVQTFKEAKAETYSQSRVVLIRETDLLRRE